MTLAQQDLEQIQQLIQQIISDTFVAANGNAYYQVELKARIGGGN